MFVDANTIIEAGKVAGVFSAFVITLYKLFKWLDNQQRQDKAIEELRAEHKRDIEAIMKENCVMCYGLFATLDGLKQLGANGNVTDAYNKLEKHINKTAHDQKEG